jgi:hypothetical protein
MISCHVGFNTCFNLDSRKLIVLNTLVPDASALKGDSLSSLFLISGAFGFGAEGRVKLSEDAVIAVGESCFMTVEEDERGGFLRTAVGALRGSR